MGLADRGEARTEPLRGRGLGRVRPGQGGPVRLPDPDDLGQRGALVADLRDVGEPYGGAVALQLALRRPDAVASLTLYEPVRFALLFGARGLAAAGDEIVGVGRHIAALAAAGDSHAAAAQFVAYWSGAAAWQSMPRSRQDAVAARMTKVRAEFAALFDDAVPACAYAALTMPVRLLRGDASPLPARGVASRLNELLPCATLVTLRGGVHMQPVSDPCSVVAALPHWLARRRAEETALVAAG